MSDSRVYRWSCCVDGDSFVVCNNLSLQYNTVGFYQLMKVMTTPVVVVLQVSLWGGLLHEVGAVEARADNQGAPEGLDRASLLASQLWPGDD